MGDQERVSSVAAAFDAFAGTYDADFTHTHLGKMLRARVWQLLARHFQPGQHILELACGTGEDAVWLARHGLRVTATDASPAMCDQTAAKARQMGLSGQIDVRPLSWQDLGDERDLPPGPYDGLLSNFGGLNTTNRWAVLAHVFSRLIRPGGRVVLVPMGPCCPWEIAWYAAHGQFRAALRRLRGPATARIGPSKIPIWYPSLRTLQSHFRPWFRVVERHSLGLWLPPSYLGHLVTRQPDLFARLNRLERATARLTAPAGDHYIVVLERRPGNETGNQH